MTGKPKLANGFCPHCGEQFDDDGTLVMECLHGHGIVRYIVWHEACLADFDKGREIYEPAV